MRPPTDVWTRLLTEARWLSVPAGHGRGPGLLSLQRASRCGRAAGIGLAVIAIALLSAQVVSVGQWLVVNQSPKPADAIVVLGGGPINRIARAVELFECGYAPILLVSGGSPYTDDRSQAQEMLEEAMRRGVPRSRILLEQHSTTTLQNAEDTLATVLGHPFHSLLVVSSNYHMRRVALLFGRVYRPYAIELTYVAASDPWFQPDHWWSNDLSIRLTLSEYLKLAYALVETLPLAFLPPNGTKWHIRSLENR